jgi:hypothetical protein
VILFWKLDRIFLLSPGTQHLYQYHASYQKKSVSVSFPIHPPSLTSFSASRKPLTFDPLTSSQPLNNTRDHAETSKRGTTHKRARIQHKAAEGRRKSKKAAAKSVQWKSSGFLFFASFFSPLICFVFSFRSLALWHEVQKLIFLVFLLTLTLYLQTDVRWDG